MQIIDSATKLLELCSAHRAAGRSIGLVPTMGYLHSGHLSLVQTLRPKVDVLVASIFVNPTQFGPQEDLDSYPRDEQGDLEKLKEAQVDLVFLPSPAEMYPESGEVQIAPPTIASRLCGASRPGHFAGVCTVVMKLFQLSRCTAAIFGEKDFQQLQVLRAMNRQLWLGIAIHGGSIVRDSDGLALSSRNAYLSSTERELAICLSKGLLNAKRAYQSATAEDEIDAESIRQVVASTIPTDNSTIDIDYIEVVNPKTLEPTTQVNHDTRVILAVKVGKTRLIDNADLGTSDSLSALL